jgi:hypothetical protein
MDIIFDKKRNFVYETFLTEFPYSYEELLTDLKQEDWISSESEGLLGKFRAPTLKSEKLKYIIEWFTQDSACLKIIKNMYQDEEYFNEWKLSAEELDNITHSSALWTLDKPGYHAATHLDNRRIIGNGMIFFTEGDDPNQSTFFYSDKNGNNPLRIPTGYAQGWFAANTNDAWHEGFNRTADKDRYSLYFLIFMNTAKKH